MPRLNNPDYNKVESIYEFTVRDLKGRHVKLDVYKNHVCIIVNTATMSSLTGPYYKQLNKLIDKYGDSEGLRILGFPCDQFGKEPCTRKEIANHAKKNAKFDIYAKVNVNCNHAIPLYKFMKKKLGGCRLGDMIKTDYTKFIVNKNGIPVERYGAEITPEQMETSLVFYFNCEIENS